MCRRWIFYPILLLVALLLAGVWFRSYWTIDDLHYTRFLYTEPFKYDGTIPQDVFQRYNVQLAAGSLRFLSGEMTQDAGDKGGWIGWEYYSLPTRDIVPEAPPALFRRLGISFYWGHGAVQIPLWPLALICFVLIWEPRRRKRRAKTPAFPLESNFKP